jgi:hypothetical protein
MAERRRPFTAELITELVASGVLVAPIVLHTGVSSQERHERPYPERYRVPEHTARLVNAVHLWGGRVVATGHRRSCGSGRSRRAACPVSGTWHRVGWGGVGRGAAGAAGGQVVGA